MIDSESRVKVGVSDLDLETQANIGNSSPDLRSSGTGLYLTV